MNSAQIVFFLTLGYDIVNDTMNDEWYYDYDIKIMMKTNE